MFIVRRSPPRRSQTPSATRSGSADDSFRRRGRERTSAGLAAGGADTPGSFAHSACWSHAALICVVRNALHWSSVASAPPPLSLRLGRNGLRALDEIARSRGVTRAEAARQAIAETAERERNRAGLAAEARALMNDRAYVREAREVAALMEQLRGPW